MLGLLCPLPASFAPARGLIVLFALIAGGIHWAAQAAPNDTPPGITVEPPAKAPGADDEEEDDGPELPGGPGCPVNERPLELLV